MKFTQEQIEEIEALAGVGYTVRQIAMYFNLPWDELQQEFNNPESTFRYHYDRGVLITRASVDMSNVTLAKKGNLTAAALIQKSLKISKYYQVKQEIFHGKY
jgi:hypothetical protein